MTKLLLIALLSTGAAATGPAATPHAPNQTRIDNQTRLADVWSPRCATPVGICFVAPQPVGSPCLCGNVGGTIIP
jgi:hypothetical protein